MPSILSQRDSSLSGVSQRQTGTSILAQRGSPLSLSEKPKDRIFSGGIVSDIGDVLSVGQYALAGGVHGMIEGNGFLKGAGEGIQNRASWTDILKEHAGLKDNPKAAAVLGTVMDIVVDPLNFIPVGKVAGAIGKGAMKASDLTGVTKAVREMAAPQGLLEFLNKHSKTVFHGGTVGEVLDRISADSELLKKLDVLSDEMIKEKGRILEGVGEVSKDVNKWSEPVSKLMYDYITEPGDKTKILAKLGNQLQAEGVTDIAGKTQKFINDAEATRKLQGNLLKEKQAIGYLENTYNPNYLRRSYQMYDNPEKWNKMLQEMSPQQAEQVFKTIKDFGIEPVLENGVVKEFKWIGSGKKVTGEEMASLLERTVIPKHVRDAMGEIKDVRYAVAKGGLADANLISKTKFLDAVSENFSKDFLRGRDPAVAKFSVWQEARKAGYVQVPETPNWGSLAGKWIPEAVYRTLDQAEKSPTMAAKLIKSGYSWWKTGKTILNPATHARNTFSNFILADWGAGLTPGSPRWWKYVTQAARELTGKGEAFQEAKQAGTFLVDTFAGHELPAILRDPNASLNTNKLAGIFAKIGKKAGDVYEFEEQLGKMTLYLAKRDELIKGGMDAATAAKTAAQEAEKWLFNYRKVPRWLDNWRNPSTVPGLILSNPFITFTYKAAPRVAETLLTHPERISKYYKFGHGIEAMSDEGEAGAERKVLPKWMKNGVWLKLPTKDKYGRSLYLDATYLFPLADIEGSSVTGPGQKPPFMNMPFVTLMTDLMRNQNQFSGKPIWDEGDDKLTAGKKIADYLTSFFLPSLAPGGYGFKGIRDAAVGKPDWLGRTRSLGAALGAYIAGFKTRPIDYNEELSWRIKEIEDQLNNTQFQMKKAMANPAISEKEKEHIWNMGMERINDLLGQMDDMVS